MGLLNLPRIPRGASPDQMANIYNMAIEEMEHRVNGFLQSNNIQEVGGWRVGQTELQSKDGDVGMSTTDTAGDDVRFWAGSTFKEFAPYRVTKSGKAYLTGAKIVSDSAYPYVEMDPQEDLFGAYTSATEYIQIRSQHYSSGYVTPLFEFGYMGDVAFMYFNGSGFGLSVARDININANGDLVKLSHARVPGWSNISTPSETLDSKFAYYDSQISALTSDLAGKASLFHTHSVTIPGHNHGISDLTGLATSGGGSVTYSSYGGTTVTAF